MQNIVDVFLKIMQFACFVSFSFCFGEGGRLFKSLQVSKNLVLLQHLP